MGCSNSKTGGGDHRNEGITDVSQLRFEEGLKWLQLNSNKIVDVSGLTLPQELESLYLQRNQITDVSCITKRSCPNLTRLDLSRNPISQAEVDRIREELVGCVVKADDLLPAPDLKLAPSSDLPQKDHGVDKDDDLPPSYDQAGVADEDDDGGEDLPPTYDDAMRPDTVL